MDEAAAHRRRGALDETGLRVLAALHDYRLP